jgi:hypothetical protein
MENVVQQPRCVEHELIANRINLYLALGGAF